jgi:DNA-binding transcriptional ArsR family regulator
MTTDDAAKLQSLMSEAIRLTSEPVRLERGNEPPDGWSWVSIVAERDSASIKLRVRNPASKKGLWIIDVGSYDSGLCIRKRSLGSIESKDVAALFDAGLVEERRKTRSRLAKLGRQDEADALNDLAPGCGVIAIVLPAGSIGVEMRCPATREQVIAMQQAAIACGLEARS